MCGGHEATGHLAQRCWTRCHVQSLHCPILHFGHCLRSFLHKPVETARGASAISPPPFSSVALPPLQLARQQVEATACVVVDSDTGLAGFLLLAIDVFFLQIFSSVRSGEGGQHVRACQSTERSEAAQDQHHEHCALIIRELPPEREIPSGWRCCRRCSLGAHHGNRFQVQRFRT